MPISTLRWQKELSCALICQYAVERAVAPVAMVLSKYPWFDTAACSNVTRPLQQKLQHDVIGERGCELFYLLHQYLGPVALGAAHDEAVSVYVVRAVTAILKSPHSDHAALTQLRTPDYDCEVRSSGGLHKTSHHQDLMWQ